MDPAGNVAVVAEGLAFPHGLALTPDGISMAPDGTCWYADVPGRAVVGVAEGDEVRARAALDRGGFSCALAPDGRSLYVAAAHRPGGERMSDPMHVWDGSIVQVPVPEVNDRVAP